MQLGMKARLNPVLLTCIICSNVETFTVFNRCEDASLHRRVLHQTDEVALLDAGSITSYLCVDRLPYKVLWFSTVLKE